MKTYSELMSDALKANRERVECLHAFQPIIIEANKLAEEYKKEEGIYSIYLGYPTSGEDHFLIKIYLSEKGKIIKDCGSFIDELILNTGLQIEGDVFVNADQQEKAWTLYHRGISYNSNGVQNPRVRVVVDAKKSENCIRVDTGRTTPVYEFICREEG